MPDVFEIEKADPLEGTITFVAFKCRPLGSGEADREGDGLDPVYAQKAFAWWVSNYGETVSMFHPTSRTYEDTYVGLYDTHRQPIPADLQGAWYFADEQKARVKVRPHDIAVAQKAARGGYRGSSWAGPSIDLMQVRS